MEFVLARRLSWGWSPSLRAKLTRAVAVCVLMSLAGMPFPSAGQSLRVLSTRESIKEPPPGGNSDSRAPLISGDGRYVLFASMADNLASITNSLRQASAFPPSLNVYLRDRLTATTVLVSVDATGTGAGNGDSLPSGISSDGRYVLFESSASNLVAGDTNNAPDVFVRDLATGRTVLVSVSLNGSAGNGESRSAAITPNGHYVTFVSEASNLVAGDANRLADVFVRDLQLGTTVLASVNARSNGPMALMAATSEAPEITPDGRYVAFYSTATNLCQGAARINGLYVRDLVNSNTVWASKGAGAAALSAWGKSNVVAFNQRLSTDGRYLAYEVIPANSASDLGKLATYGMILRFDALANATEVVSTNAAVEIGPLENLRSLDMTPDGRFIAYVGNSNSAAGTTTCVLVWDGSTRSTALASSDTKGNVTANSFCAWPAMDSSGRTVAFGSSATGLVTNALAGDYHLYSRDLQAGTIRLLAVDNAGSGAPALATSAPQLSLDGDTAAFELAAARGAVQASDIFVDKDGLLELASSHDPSLGYETAQGLSTITAAGLSRDGRFVAFTSDAPDIADNDTNRSSDVFWFDVESRKAVLVSVATNGFSGNGLSTEGAISADGRYVAFTSAADNLVPGDNNRVQDVFVRDTVAGTTALVSVNRSGGPGNKASYQPVITPGGRYVLFRTLATDLALGMSTVENLVLRDLEKSTNYLLTPRSAGEAVLSRDGNYIAYIDNGSLGNGPATVYVWDVAAPARIYTNVLTASAGVPTGLAISANGNRVAFAIKGALFSFGRDAQGLTVVEAVTNAIYKSLCLSSDGQVLVCSRFISQAPITQVWRYDLQNGTSVLVSHKKDGTEPGDGPSDTPTVSPNGQLVAFRSAASDLVFENTNATRNVFLYNHEAGLNTLASRNSTGDAGGNRRSTRPFFSADGLKVVFTSWSGDLTPGDFNNSPDTYIYEPLYAMITLGGNQGPWLSWPSMPGRSYQVQFKSSLNEAVWNDVTGAVTNSGTRAWLQDTAPAPEERFYRVLGFNHD